jgi:hypothetical protein
LNPNITKKYMDDLKKGAEELLIDVKLDVALYRMGHTKARDPSTLLRNDSLQIVDESLSPPLLPPPKKKRNDKQTPR